MNSLFGPDNVPKQFAGSFLTVGATSLTPNRGAIHKFPNFSLQAY